MAKKEFARRVTKLLGDAVKKLDSHAVLAEALGIQLEGRVQMLIDGEVEISAANAIKIEKLTGLSAKRLMEAQAADALEAAGYEEAAVAPVKVERAKGTGTDGMPSQSPMSKDRGHVSMSFSGVSDAQANKAVRAVMQSFAE
jgi:plasmid maintenance system antidote protein VapI